MGKLTVTTNAKVKPQDLPSVENPISTVDPLPPKPGAPLTHFVVPQPSAPPVYRPPGRTNGCSKKCKAAIMAAVVLVLVVALIVTGVFFLKAHRRAEKPPCLRSSEERHASHESEEEEDCDEEKNGKWYDWLENCMNQWYGRQPGGKDREEDGPPSSEEGGPPPPRPGTP
ncbi:Hypp1922 [Branchiostoma lanceolatum]|uniref:Hypp1922 protein n=1 Tax=Branchiostoma lanceolatum TaxID=7740 RepID=A0A8J9ZP78_BRALA|nr:Hypp1922 [Branchiostoma lanceolatum]